MKDWFEEFHRGLKSSTTPSDLVGAGKASAAEAFDHYRYQFRIKVKESVLETFPGTVKLLGEDWEYTWKKYLSREVPSPRSLDWVPEDFLNFFLETDADFHLKELARFELAMDIHPWTHPRLSRTSLEGMDEEASLVLAPLDLRFYQAPVTRLHQGLEYSDIAAPQNVLIWMRDDGLNYRVMQDWELKVLETLPSSVAEALEHAPEDEEAVSDFFRWLGESCLIRQIIHNG